MVSRSFCPYIPFAFAMILGLMIYSHRHSYNHGSAVPYIVTVSLVIAGAILTGFNITIQITDIYQLAGKPVNDELPFIIQLTLSPVIAVVAGVFVVRRLGTKRYFRTGSGRSDVSIMQRTVWQETRSQARLLFIINLLLAVTEWTYTVFIFSSESINRPDKFIYLWLPVIVYILSVIYLGLRCISMCAFYSQHDPVKMLAVRNSSTIRYLIVHDNSIYLSTRQLDVKHGMESFYDTPARLRDNRRDNITGSEAADIFARYTGIDAGHFCIRYLFSRQEPDFDYSLFHFICVVNDPSAVNNSRIDGGKWYTLTDIKKLDYAHSLSAELSAELVHIHTIASTWKTYDINGNRRYDIKHYTPAYRLSDIAGWNVDFDDPRWLSVSRHNADKPFFKLRRYLLRRHTSTPTQ